MSGFLKIVRHLLVVSLVLALLPQPIQAQPGGSRYVVQPGDTLFGIAQQFGITVEALQAANPAVDAALL